MGRPKKDPQEPKKSDKDQIEEQLGNFKPDESPFVRSFMSSLGKPRHRVILTICGRIAELERIPPLSRIEKKSKELAKKWIHDHWTSVEPHIGEFRLYASDGTLISKEPRGTV
jgi:hypothetical protein